MLGKHCLVTRCKHQSVIAFSSGEAELYAAVLACSMGIGTNQMYCDLRINVKIQIVMDANAGISMMKRQGLGSVKHVANQYLWVQETVYNKDVELPKVGTT